MINTIFIQSEVFNTILGFIGLGICFYIVYNLYTSNNKTVMAVCSQAIVCVANFIPSLYSLGKAAGFIGDKVTEIFMKAIFPTNNLLWILIGFVIVHLANGKQNDSKVANTDNDKE